MRKLLIVLLAWVILIAATLLAPAQSDPLPSWNDGAAKSAIVAFVARVTEGANAVPEAERIAVFDNDGTLWAEQPMYFQVVFALDRVRELAPRHPEWRTLEPFRSFLADDKSALHALDQAGVLQLLAASHAGMTTEAFASSVRNWLASARHPRFQRPYTELAYQPMLELLAYLRGRGFKTFIVSGGGVEFMRIFAEHVYGIPPEQIVGSSGATEFRIGDGAPELMKLPKVEFVNDGPGKPVGINRFIGRRPLLAFGNSDGDHAMLQWTVAGPGARFAGIVHHTDPAREWAYDRASHIGRLDKALDEAFARGWTVVDMRRDWKRVFAFE